MDEQGQPEDSLPAAIAAFTGGAILIGAALVVFLLLRTGRAQPSSHVLAADHPCTGRYFDSCLQPLPEVQAMAGTWADCQVSGRRVCLIPIGAVSLGLVNHLEEHFRQRYGLELILGPAIGVPPSVVAGARTGPEFGSPQFDIQKLVSHLDRLRQEAGFPDEAIEGLTMIGVTSLDVYISRQPNWRWAFGQTFHYDIGGEPRAWIGVISYFRMDDRIYRLRYSDERFAARIRKMVSKYVGLLYYDFPLSPDPRSPMYDSIGGLADLEVGRESSALDPRPDPASGLSRRPITQAELDVGLIPTKLRRNLCPLELEAPRG